MLGRHRSPHNGGAFESILGKSMEIRGTLRSTGSFRIDGTAEANIQSQGDVMVGPGARVTGDIDAQNVTICGCVVGNVRCSGRLELLPGADLKGDITVASLVVSEGAMLSGKVTMDRKAEQTKT